MQKKEKPYMMSLMVGVSLILLLGLMSGAARVGAASINEETPPPPLQMGEVTVVSPFYSTQEITLSNGMVLTKSIINGPRKPLSTHTPMTIEAIPQAATLVPNFPSFDWVYGCSAVSAAMIAAHQDANGYPNLYTGPTNGGVYPQTDTGFGTWKDSAGVTYPNNPLVASRQGLDGLTTRGSINDYWVKYNSTTQDPFITGGWTQHTYGTSIGDYMRTSQSNYDNPDGSTGFYNYSNKNKLTCDLLESNGNIDDGNVGRSLFYRNRGYMVTECYNQLTDNQISGGFSLASYKAEINAGRAVMLHLEGHTIVGFGYDGSTIYIRDTWDSNPGNHYTMTWGGSYQGMRLHSVSILKLAPFNNIFVPFITR